MAAEGDLELHSIDISNAFLNADLHKDVYVQQPDFYSNSNTDICLKLNKSLYGLKQAPLEWFKTLTNELAALQFTQSDNDEALWIKSTGSAPVYLLLYVDDMLLASSNLTQLQDVKNSILNRFKGKDLGKATRYLNIDIHRDRGNRTIKISQPQYIINLLTKFKMDSSNPVSTPAVNGADLTAARDDDKMLDGTTPYAECVGALLYLQATTRPDISYIVNVLSKHMSKPTERHWTAAKHLLRYLKGTADYGITYQGGSKHFLIGYVDADYAADKDTRKSRTGYVYTAAGGAITWSSKQQAIVATSTCEAEYVAAAEAAKEGIFLRRIFQELGNKTASAVSIKCDNIAAIQVATSTGPTSRVKHIEIRYHFLRAAINKGLIDISHIASADNPADALTKALARDKIKFHLKQIGVKLN